MIPAGPFQLEIFYDSMYFSFFFFFLQLCVSKCPDRFATYIDVQASYRYRPDQWNYFKQYCKPGFNNPRKVCMYQKVMGYIYSPGNV